MHNFKELIVWKEAMKTAKAVYAVSAGFPQDERFGLISQIRRCAVSVPSNIAEGAGRKPDREFFHFLSVSAGSACELETQLLLSCGFGFVTRQELEPVLESIGGLQKMLYRFQEQLESKTKNK